MAKLFFQGIGITAMAAAVPKHIINNYHYTDHWSVEEIKQVVDKIGIFERRFADETPAHLIYVLHAAEKLINRQ